MKFYEKFLEQKLEFADAYLMSFMNATNQNDVSVTAYAKSFQQLANEMKIHEPYVLLEQMLFYKVSFL